MISSILINMTVALLEICGLSIFPPSRNSATGLNNKSKMMNSHQPFSFFAFFLTFFRFVFLLVLENRKAFYELQGWRRWYNENIKFYLIGWTDTLSIGPIGMIIAVSLFLQWSRKMEAFVIADEGMAFKWRIKSIYGNKYNLYFDQQSDDPRNLKPYIVTYRCNGWKYFIYHKSWFLYILYFQLTTWKGGV